MGEKGEKGIRREDRRTSFSENFSSASVSCLTHLTSPRLSTLASLTGVHGLAYTLYGLATVLLPSFFVHCFSSSPIGFGLQWRRWLDGW
ncbi:hypothetical protein K474DRAFT_1664111 [Panus rudis PR-1116 ss-1]|nr:hypothetical protein K474DRAFT_1664111 [Panus rudis PR-1116 ss-1]